MRSFHLAPACGHGVALLACFCILDALCASEWRQFRGSSGQGLSQATGVPVTWDAKNNIRWRTPVEGNGWSSPILSNDRVYVTSAVVQPSSGASLRAVCLDAQSGRVIWNVEALSADREQVEPVHEKNSLASPTPLVDFDRLYVHFGHMGTAALDFDGKVIWRQTALEYSPVHGNGGSPALVDDLVVFSCDGGDDPFLAALDRLSGKIRWKTPRRIDVQKSFSFSTPLVIEVAGKKQIVCPASGLVAGYDPKDGVELWRVRYGDGYSVIPRPVFAHGLLFICTGFDRPAVYAIRPVSHGGDLTGTHVVWRHTKGAPNTPSPIVVGDELYFVSDAGVASCLDARTGKVHWSERLGGALSASPVAAENRLYFLNEEGTCYVVSADTTFNVLSTNELGERTLASPAVMDGALILRSESHLWRIGK
jgi:outer membrane protein assembly factor BamB